MAIKSPHVFIKGKKKERRIMFSFSHQDHKGIIFLLQMDKWPVPFDYLYFSLNTCLQFENENFQLGWINKSGLDALQK
jgi:hypothetical protein